MRSIDRIVIHCSATQCNKSYPPSSMLRDHKARGFITYGYHYYIRTGGELIPLRSIEQMGAHVKGYNANSIGICYEGGLDEKGKARDTRIDEQKKTMFNLLQSLCLTYDIVHLDGHRDLSPDLNDNGIVEPEEWTKICPCFDVRSEYISFLPVTVIRNKNSRIHDREK